MHSRGNAPPLGRVMPTPPGAQGPPLGSAAVRGSYAGSGLATSRKPGAGPVELVLREPATEPLGGKSPTSVYDTPQDQGAAIKQLLKENQNLKLKVYFMEEKFRTQVARLGAPGGVDALLQESLDAQVQLKAAKEEMAQREELLARARDTIDALHRDLAAAHATASTAVADAAAAAAKRAHAEAAAAVTREQLMSMLSDLKARQDASTSVEAALLAADMARAAAEAGLAEARTQVTELQAQLQARAAAAATSRHISDVMVEAAQAKEVAATAQCSALRAELVEVRTGTPAPRTLAQRNRDAAVAASPAVASVRAALAFGTPVGGHKTTAETQTMPGAQGEADEGAGQSSEYEQFLVAQVAQLEEELADMAQLVESSAAEAARARAALSPLQATSTAAVEAAQQRAALAERRCADAEAAAAAAAGALGTVQDALDVKHSQLADMSAQVMAMAQRMRAITSGAATPGAPAPSPMAWPGSGGGGSPWGEPSALQAAFSGLERELASARATAAAASTRARASEEQKEELRAEVDSLREEAEALASELADAKEALAEAQQAVVAAQRAAEAAEETAAQASAQASAALDELARAKARAERKREQERQAAAAAAAAAVSDAQDVATAERWRAESARLRGELDALTAALAVERAALDAARGRVATQEQVGTPARRAAGAASDSVVPATPVIDASGADMLTSEALDALEAMLAATPDQENAGTAALVPGRGKALLEGVAATRLALDAVGSSLARINTA